MTLQGKGFMIWQVPNCEGGNPNAIAAAALEANLSHVLIKIADSSYAYNINKTTGVDMVYPIVQALHSKGIQAWGWHYVYGYNPEGEANIAVNRVNDLGLDGYVIDAEVEYKLPGRDVAATTFMNKLRQGIPNTPVALCSFRFPSYHRELPWTEFLDQCDYNMPQVYWQEAHNAGAQLERSVSELLALTPSRPVIPTGPVYKVGDWVPYASDITEFLSTAKSLGLSAANFFAWDYGRSILPDLWNAVSDFDWSSSTSYVSIPQQLINLYNTQNIDEIISMYTEDAVHITAAQTVQGKTALQAWYTNLFEQVLPNAEFTVTNVTESDNVRHFTWTATSSNGSVSNGNDTIGLIDGIITYHYSFFTVG